MEKQWLKQLHVLKQKEAEEVQCKEEAQHKEEESRWKREIHHLEKELAASQAKIARDLAYRQKEEQARVDTQVRKVCEGLMEKARRELELEDAKACEENS